MSSAATKRATYEDVLSAPDTKVAEVIDGVLSLSPRPAGEHASATTLLCATLVRDHDRRLSSTGGWVILFEPELHLGDDILVPDIAAWRYENRPASMDVAYFERAPDWACEMLSPSTSRLDRVKKVPRYARARVSHVWLIDPAARTLEALALDGETYRLVHSASDDDVVAPPPFVEPPVELARLWAW